MSQPPALSAALADRYQIERELGAGGMATVYLAHDIRHERKVALKVLRPELAAVIGATRFLAEIKTTANLQHPHILPLHDSGEVDGTVFYVMPFVDGESLRDRLTREKQLPVDEAVRITVEVAGALEYAHRHKVIHRDIKPENILLQGGHALVADFGIALAASRAEGGTRMTETGMSLGTPHYMSPEQAMGEREITAKSDVYALGCVLYEMLTGEPPFNGPTAQAIVARVMTEEPRSLVLQRRTIPRHVEAAVHRALSKLPADRFASAAEFADALLHPGAMPLPNAGTPRQAAQRVRPLPAVGAAAVVVLASAGAFLGGRRTAPEPVRPLVHFGVALPESVVAVSRCCGNAMALSPDGNVLVFVGVAPGGSGPLYRRTLGELQAQPIPGTEGGSVPFFSPDGRWVGFFADGRLRKVSLAGGPAIPIVSVTPTVTEASWGEDDRIVFADGTRLHIVPAGGGEPTQVAAPDSGTRYYSPWLLPGGRAALFTIRGTGTTLESARIGLLDLGSGRIDTIAFGTRATYALGHLLYSAADHTLLVQPFDPNRGRTTGSAVALIERLVLHGNTSHEFAVSGEGALVYQPQGGDLGGEQLRLQGPEGRTMITFPAQAGNVNLEDPAFSPDGERIAARLRTQGTDVQEIWLFNRRQETLERFTVDGGYAPVWSRDGRRIAYGTRGGIQVRMADQTGEAELVLPGSSLHPGSWLPDGRSLVFQASARPGTLQDIGIVTLGDSMPRWLVATEFRERHPQVSRDGRWLAYASDRTGRFEVYVQPLEGNGPRVQISNAGGDSPRWSPDGGILYYVSQASIVGATLTVGPEIRVAGRRVVVEGGVTDLNPVNVNWDIHPNGREFLFIEEYEDSEVRLLWMLNWPELLRGKQ